MERVWIFDVCITSLFFYGASTSVAVVQLSISSSVFHIHVRTHVDVTSVFCMDDVNKHANKTSAVPSSSIIFILFIIGLVRVRFSLG